MISYVLLQASQAMLQMYYSMFPFRYLILQKYMFVFGYSTHFASKLLKNKKKSHLFFEILILLFIFAIVNQLKT